MADEAQRLMALFAGFGSAHGTHGVPTKKPDTIKWEIKTSASTIREPVTLELWELHLAGKRPLGIITIREDGKVKWASIDYDVYDENPLEIIERLEDLKLPLLPVRSKSGGLHLFMFFEDWTPAINVLPVLRDISARMGIAGSEVFPRQTQVLVERGDLGNWMVMPYYGDTYGGKIKEQFGLKRTGAEMSISEFLRTAEGMLLGDKDLEKLVRKSGSGSASVRRARKNGGRGDEPASPFGDGPPCLQTLAADGVPAGCQSNALLMMGIYFKRKYPMEWREKLEEAGRVHLQPPSSSEGMQSVIKSLEKKDYEYTCKTEPMVSHCNSALCRTRQHGVGDEGAYPVITGMSKLETDPPIWFVAVGDNVQVELSIAELRTYELFCRKVADKKTESYVAMAHKDWLKVVHEAMKNALPIPAPDTGESGMFMELLEDFLTNRSTGDSLEELWNGRPFHDVSQGRYYFRLRDLHSFLQREGMKESRSKVFQRIHTDLRGQKENVHLKGKFCRAVWVPAQKIQQAPELSVPRGQESPV